MNNETAIRDLTQKLEEARPDLERFDNYYSGRQPLAFLAPEVREAVGDRLQSLVVNWPRLVVGAVEERLDVQGFRIGETTDTRLWEVWQANGLDEYSQLAHTDALVYGRSYAIVWAGPDPEVPRITVESPKQVTVEHAPGSRVRLRAIKKWVEDGYAYATLYTPDAIYRYRSLGHAPDTGDASYVPAGGWGLQSTIPNPLGVVPVVALVNRPRLLAQEGESELADVLPVADAVNKLATDMMVSAEYHAMPRRWATGVEIIEKPELDENGVPTGEQVPDPEQFASTAGRTWIAEDPEARYGQFGEASLAGFLEAIRTLTHAIASIAGLPPHYVALTATDNPASADAIRSAEASLVSKARRKMRAFGGGWEEVMRLALLVRDGTLPTGMDRLETVWRDPETRTVAQAADAATKLVAAGILPVQQALEDLGYSPVQIERMREMRRQDALDRTSINTSDLMP